MKIITGLAKGMNLETLEGERTRPTSQRVKEAVFSMIQFDIEGTAVLDLFAGCGQMGLEALSRGAKKAVFCDSSKEAYEIVLKNAKKTRLFEKCRISNCDYAQMLRGIAEKEVFDIVFLDPPYAMDCIDKILTQLATHHNLSSCATVICETGKEFALSAENESYYTILKQNRYAVSYITILKLKGEEQ